MSLFFQILIGYLLVSIPVARHWAGNQYRQCERKWEEFNSVKYGRRPTDQPLSLGITIFILSFVFMWAILPVFLIDKGFKAIPKNMVEGTKNSGKQAAKYAFIGRAPKAEREEKTKAQLQARITELEKDLELENAI